MVNPLTNKSLRFSSPGADPEVVEKHLPPLLSNEILVKVHVASINPVDIQLWRNGLVGVVSGDKGIGRDFSGTVTYVGSEVQDWAVGDEIYGLLFEIFGQGTFSEHIHFNPKKVPVAKKPNCLTHEAAAAVPLVALTAFACLDWLPPQSEDQRRRVVVRGASGGTGSCIVQLAKVVYDCHVTAICSSQNLEYVRMLGSDDVVDYTSQDVVDALLEKKASSKPFDLIIDCVGGTDFFNAHIELLSPNGAYVTIVGDKTGVKTLGGPPTYVTTPAQILRFIKGYIWGPRYACISFLTKSSLLEKVSSLAEHGEIQVPIQEIIPAALSEPQSWKHAVSLIESGRIRGKVVLRIS